MKIIKLVLHIGIKNSEKISINCEQCLKRKKKKKM